MKELLAGITALGLLIASPSVANAHQNVKSTISEDRASSAIERGRNILEPSSSSSFNDRQLIAQSVARLNFSWSVAPFELARTATEFIFKAETSDLIAYVLLLLSGHDVYVVKVNLSNTGNVPLRIYPQNIRIDYGKGSTSAIAIQNNRFLQPSILDPNYYLEQPVIFIAPSDVNLNNVRIGYAENSAQVTYN